MNTIVDKEQDKSQKQYKNHQWKASYSLPTWNYSVCETDDLACQSQVLRSNRLQTWHLKYFL